MRIITGKARGTSLFTLDGMNTRPTSDRAKEGIFNILQCEIEGKKVLDLFGGSGQLALECLSRGAENAVICDNNADACKIIKKNTEKTHFSDKVTILNCDFKTAIKNSCGQKYDLIFIDPPYNSDLVSISLFKVFENDLIADNGFVICENNIETPFSNNSAELFKHVKYGKAYISILRKKTI